MESLKAIPPEAPVSTPVMAEGTAPWAQEEPAPRTVPARAAVVARPPETVHWGVVMLTLFTAIAVLMGGAGKRDTRSQELLPIVMIAR